MCHIQAEVPIPPRKNSVAFIFKGCSTRSVCMEVHTVTTWCQEITSKDTRLNFPSVEVLETLVQDTSWFI